MAIVNYPYMIFSTMSALGQKQTFTVALGHVRF
jgi:hypothetical protein